MSDDTQTILFFQATDVCLFVCLCVNRSNVETNLNVDHHHHQDDDGNDDNGKQTKQTKQTTASVFFIYLLLLKTAKCVSLSFNIDDNDTCMSFIFR